MTTRQLEEVSSFSEEENNLLWHLLQAAHHEKYIRNKLCTAAHPPVISK